MLRSRYSSDRQVFSEVFMHILLPPIHRVYKFPLCDSFGRCMGRMRVRSLEEVCELYSYDLEEGCQQCEGCCGWWCPVAWLLFSVFPFKWSEEKELYHSTMWTVSPSVCRMFYSFSLKSLSVVGRVCTCVPLCLFPGGSALWSF